jgi:hypothetical protein
VEPEGQRPGVNAAERRSRSLNRHGERCAAKVVNGRGYCVAHDPERPADMKALGKLSGKARRKPNRARAHPELGAYMLAEVHPERIWNALEMAMTGQNESARVQASRVVMDALSAARPEGCPTCRERHAEAPAVRERAEQRLFALVAESIRAILSGNLEHAPAFAALAADQLDADLRTSIAELQG